MRPEDSARSVSERALELWRALAASYDEIDEALTSPEAERLSELAARIVSIENDLKPLVGQIASFRTEMGDRDEGLSSLWREADRLIQGLADRQPKLVRAATAARDGASSGIARLRKHRAQSAQYRQRAAAAAGPQFASRRA